MEGTEEQTQGAADGGIQNDSANDTPWTTQPPSEDNPSLRRTTTVAESLQDAPKRQLAIIVFVALTQMVQMYPYSAGIAGAYSIATSLYSGNHHSTQIVPESAQKIVAGDSAWIVASYPLTQGSFVLMGGRIGDIYGHKVILMGACMWWWIWQLASNPWVRYSRDIC